MWLKMNENYSPNFTIPKRSKERIKFVILHYTGMKKESLAIKRLCSDKSKVSAHYFIRKNGKILNLVPDLYEAWHAGKSCWKKYKLLNKYSLGIEVHNSGHENSFESFREKQIVSLKKLLLFLMKKYNIKIENILGHSDISPDRKKDPGEKFPWLRLTKLKLSIWHNLKNSQLIKLRNKKLTLIEKKDFLNNLYKFGYCRLKYLKISKSNKLLTKAFQRRFRSSLINGIADKECLQIIRNLNFKNYK